MIYRPTADEEQRLLDASARIMTMVKTLIDSGVLSEDYADGGIIAPPPLPPLPTWRPLKPVDSAWRHGDPKTPAGQKWQPLCVNCKVVHGVDLALCVEIKPPQREQCCYCLAPVATGTYVSTPPAAVPYPTTTQLPRVST